MQDQYPGPVEKRIVKIRRFLVVKVANHLKMELGKLIEKRMALEKQDGKKTNHEPKILLEVSHTLRGHS